MARPLRIRLPGGIFHVTSRGNRRGAVYCSDADRLAWLDFFARVCVRFDWSCYAWCQMTNHYHIVVETSNGELSGGMRHLNGVYTQYVNRTHDRVGHVFQGRYKAILIDRDSYLLEVSRYVVLNPVRASMVSAAEAWPWSSYRSTAGLAPTPAWLAADRIRSHFGLGRDHALASYAAFIREGVSGSTLWDKIRGQIYLGDNRFLKSVQERVVAADTSLEVPRVQRQPRRKPIASFARSSRSRHDAMALAYLRGGHTMKSIAEYFRVHYATVSRAVAAYERGAVTPGKKTAGKAPPDNIELPGVSQSAG